MVIEILWLDCVLLQSQLNAQKIEEVIHNMVYIDSKCQCDCDEVCAVWL